MNIDNFTYSASTSKNPTTSKYFSNKGVLDESLIEFQEKKKVVGPKKPLKTAPKRRTQKLAKGQKDIRSLIKKKNDLVEYSKNFNNTCKESGVDVDSEQLQLAIALSESLQYSKPTLDHNDSNISKPLTSRERSNKIRTTLQEYGFKVPDVKVTGVNKKNRKRKAYKLLTTSDEEKQQIISAKYLQVLSTNSNNVGIDIKPSKDSIFFKSTSIVYENMKNNDVFYVKGLIEKSLNSNNLLRDWSKIPGRCHSPVFEGPFIGFNDIRCSQDELDLLLSGSLVTNRTLLHEKLSDYAFQTEELSYNTSHTSEEQMSSKVLSNETLSLSMSKNINDLDIKDIETLQRDNTENYIVNETLSQPLQGLESDAFDNTTIALNFPRNETTQLSQRSQSPDLFDDEVTSILNVSSESKPLVKYDIIDLTQCVSTTKLTHVSNTTNIFSSDVMELTECIGIGFNNNDNIDLTQELNDDDTTIVYVDKNESFRENMGPLEIYNCDQEQNSIKVCRVVNDENIINVDEINTIDSINLTQSSDTSDSLPDIKVIGTNRNGTLHNITEKKYNTFYDQEVTELPNFPTYGVLESSVKATESDNDTNKKHFKEDNSSDDICLTQSEDGYNCSANHVSQSDKLSKMADLSVDYDEMFDQIIESTSNAPKHSNNLNILYVENIKANSFINEESTCYSEPLRISNQELNHSMNNCNSNSRIDFGEFQDNELPSIDMNCQTSTEECKVVTPVKEKNYEIIKTPSNNEYIIKTVEVTPIQNFEAMSSPERNKELEKYGLKPFKRKRAIQLLTYIYNQTHPVVESCDDGGPSKKTKPNSTNSKITPIKNRSQSPKKPHISPRKCNFSPKSSRSNQDISGKENIYMQTDETPAIMNIGCETEDWVFQKREKAKVHSCRVPLHVAFHNYVSCRRLLREAILCYEPINIDIVHKDLVASGYRYNPKDLLKFMDKKCITVKTADNNARNRS